MVLEQSHSNTFSYIVTSAEAQLQLSFYRCFIQKTMSSWFSNITVAHIVGGRLMNLASDAEQVLRPQEQSYCWHSVKARSISKGGRFHKRNCCIPSFMLLPKEMCTLYIYILISICRICMTAVGFVCSTRLNRKAGCVELFFK